MPPAVDLLLAIARKILRKRDVERVTRVAHAGIDWAHTIAMAEAHGLLPLLSHHVTGGSIPAPPEAIATLTQRRKRLAARSLQLAAELMAILDEAARQNIAVVPLKGPMLALSAYGSLAYRSFIDLDVLVARRDLRAISLLLQGRGYAIESLSEFVGSSNDGGHCFAARRRADRVHVEVHYELVDRRGTASRDYDAIAPRLRQRPLMGRTVPALSPEDEVIYLCEHGAAHAWSRIEWLATVTEVAGSSDLDWRRLIDLADAAGARRRVAAAAALSESLLHVTLDGAPRDPAFGVQLANAAVTRRLAASSRIARNTPWDSYRYQTLTDPSVGAMIHRGWVTAASPTVEDVRGISPAWLGTSIGPLVRMAGLARRAWHRQR